MANDNQADQNNDTQESQEGQDNQSAASANAPEVNDSQDHELTEPTLESQLAAAQEQINELKDQMVREKAETQNIRKRLQRDVENAHKYALEKFVNELLPVADNLERALGAATDDEVAKPLLEGVELTQKSLLDTLKKFNVEQLNPLGEPFDPQVHEAMAMVPNPEMESNSVMDVMQKGYMLNGRLVRAAMVVVSK